MSSLLTTEDLLLASDNHLGDLWASHYLDASYPEAIKDWFGARKFFYDAYVSHREKQSLAEWQFRPQSLLAPGSEAYSKSVQEALNVGQVVLDSEWPFEGIGVRVPVLEMTSNGIVATTVRHSKIYSRSGTKHDLLERGLVALALEKQGFPSVAVYSTRMLNCEGSEGFRREFPPPSEVSPFNFPAQEGAVRVEIAKLKSALADPMRPPDTGEYSALLDDAGLCSEDGLLKKVSAQAGLDWRKLSSSQRATVDRLMRSLHEKTMQVSKDFFSSDSFLCFSVDVIPVRSALLNPGEAGQMPVTPRALAAAWNDAHGKISSMLFRLNDLRVDSEQIAELKEKAGPVDQRFCMAECGNVHGASRMHSWFKRRLGIDQIKSLDGCYSSRNGCVHPELVHNGFTLEAWSKAFLGETIGSLSSRHPLEERLKIWSAGKGATKLDAVLCDRAELLVRGLRAAKTHLADCESRGLAQVSLNLPMTKARGF